MRPYLEHTRAVQRTAIVVPVVRRERTVVRSVPRVVQRVACVAVVAIDFQLVVVRFGMDLKVRILCVSATTTKPNQNYVFSLRSCINASSPFVAFEILQFDAQRIVLVVGQHVNVLVTQPELLGRIAKAVFVVRPVAIEVLARLAKVVATLDDLNTSPMTKWINYNGWLNTVRSDNVIA